MLYYLRKISFSYVILLSQQPVCYKMQLSHRSIFKGHVFLHFSSQRGKESPAYCMSLRKTQYTGSKYQSEPAWDLPEFWAHKLSLKFQLTVLATSRQSLSKKMLSVAVGQCGSLCWRMGWHKVNPTLTRHFIHHHQHPIFGDSAGPVSNSMHALPMLTPSKIRGKNFHVHFLGLQRWSPYKKNSNLKHTTNLPIPGHSFWGGQHAPLVSLY